MLRINSRRRTVLAVAALVAGLAPAAVGLVNAQVRKCYSLICSTVNGETSCYEKEVPCPTET
jgi:hypothetical protein